MESEPCISSHLEQAKKAKKKTDKESLKTRSDHLNELQVDINLIARLIDASTCCISSLRPCGNWKENGGHRFTVKAHGNIRFNLMNIHMQSFEENHHKSGNPDGYDKGLKHIYGDEYFNEVHNLTLKYPVLKLTIPEIMEAKKIAKQIIKELKEANKTYTVKERIALREFINIRLGMYK